MLLIKNVCLLFTILFSLFSFTGSLVSFSNTYIKYLHLNLMSDASIVKHPLGASETLNDIV